jgi:hypothetical protein
MSIPAGKAFDTIDNSNATRTESESSIGRPEPDNDPARLPYAPERARRIHVAAQAEEGDAASDGTPGFLLGDERLRTGLGEPEPAAPAEDRLLRLDEQVGLAPAEPPLETPNGEKPSECGEHPRAAPEVDETAVKVAPSESLAPSLTAPPLQHGDDPERNADDDIERLEASLRWLKRQNGELRKVDPDALVTGQPSRKIEGSAEPNAGRSAELNVGAARAFGPETLVAPALMRALRGKGKNPLASRRAPLLILFVVLLAVPIAYFVLGRSSPPLKQAPEAKLAALEPQSVAPAAAPQREPELAAAESRATVLPPAPQNDTQASERSDPEPKTIGVGARRTPTSSVAPSEPTAARAASRSEASKTAAAPVQKLSPAEVELLLKHGQQFMTFGDIAAARVAFRRAAEAGDAAAALAMGGTYDPLVLNRIGALGVRADPDLARTWYERAKDFGSPEAPRRIDMLANR